MMTIGLLLLFNITKKLEKGNELQLMNIHNEMRIADQMKIFYIEQQQKDSGIIKKKKKWHTNVQKKVSSWVKRLFD